MATTRAGKPSPTAASDSSSGLRRGEPAQVNRGMLDLEEHELRIPPGIQKDYPDNNSPDSVTFGLDRGGDLRTVRTLRWYLDDRAVNSPALFPSQKDDQLTGKAINDVVKRLARRASVEP